MNTPDALDWTDTLDDTATAAPPPPKTRAGFTTLRRTHPSLYADLRRVIRLAIDPHDWGYLHANRKAKPRANTKETLNFWLDRTITNKWQLGRHRPKLKALTLRKLEEHGANERTIYTTSHPTSGIALLMLDIDDKEGIYGDAAAVLDHLARWFPRMYRQPSTFAKGAHGYLAVDWRGMTAAGFRSLLDTFEKAVAANVRASGFGSTFELKAKPGETTARGIYKTCGTLAKFPRLESPEAVEAFIGQIGRMYPAGDLQAAIDELGGLPLGLAAESRPAAPPIESAGTPLRQPEPLAVKVVRNCQDGGTWGFTSSSPSSSLITMSTARLVDIVINEEEGEEASTTDPARRMGDCGRALARQLGRAPSAVEFLAEYQRKNYHTGDDKDGNRARLAERNAAWLARTFIPGMGDGYDEAEQLAIIAKAVRPEHREAVKRKNRTAYTDAQLAVVLYTVERAATTRHANSRYQFGLPNTSFVTMLDKLGHPLKGTDLLQRQKLSAMKWTLEAANLITTIDGTWRFGNGKGRGKKYGLAPAHPRYADHLDLVRRFTVSDESE